MANTAVGGVAGQGYFGLLIDDKTPPATPGLLRSCFIIENPISIPCAVIEFSDRDNKLRNQNAIVDGTKFTISMGPNKDLFETLDFKVIGVREYDSNGSRIIRAVCAFDASSFIYDSRSYSIQGTSRDALQRIASTCGMFLDMPNDMNPADNMKWLSSTQSPKRFASEIEKHMWLGEDAMPKMIISADKRIIVRDLSKVIEQEPKAVFAFNVNATQDNEIAVAEMRAKSAAGTFNGVSNYGDTLLWSDSKGQINELKSVNVKSRDPLNINSDIRGDIVGARRQYARATNDANIHTSYNKAYYNWRRQAMTYTETCRALVRGGCPSVGLLDCVDVKAGLQSDNAQNNTDVKLSGKWIVIGKTRSYYSGQYSDTVLLTRNFTPVEGTTGVGGGANLALTAFPTIADILRPFQINTNIKQSLDGSSPIDFLSQSHELRLNIMLDQFQTDSEAFKFPALAQKYGEGADYLKSVLQEYNMAAFVNGICGALSKLEKQSISLVIDYGPTILNSLASRIDAMEGMMDGFTSDINGLISDGEIPDYYLDGPQINQRCVSNKIGDLQKALDDNLPDKCMDALSLQKLLGPKTNLAQLLRQADEDLRNLLCSMGDGTVDGSNTTGTPDGRKLEMYMPGVTQ